MTENKDAVGWLVLNAPSFVRACTKEQLEENEQLLDLVAHCWVHSGYQDCGRDQMTTEQKAFYDAKIAAIIKRND